MESLFKFVSILSVLVWIDFTGPYNSFFYYITEMIKHEPIQELLEPDHELEYVQS